MVMSSPDKRQRWQRQDSFQKDEGLPLSYTKYLVPVLLFVAALAYMYGFRQGGMETAELNQIKTIPTIPSSDTASKTVVSEVQNRNGTLTATQLHQSTQKAPVSQAKEDTGGVVNHVQRQRRNGTLIGIYNQESFHWEVVAGYMQMASSMFPGEVTVYVKPRPKQPANNLGYGFNDLVGAATAPVHRLPRPVQEHDVLIFISPEYNVSQVKETILAAKPRLVLILIHNGDGAAVQALMNLHKSTRIITLSPHVHKFLFKRFRIAPRHTRMAKTPGALAGAVTAQGSTAQSARKLQAVQDDGGAAFSEVNQQYRPNIIHTSERTFAFSTASDSEDPSHVRDARSTQFLRQNSDPATLLAAAQQDFDNTVDASDQVTEQEATFGSLIRRVVPRVLLNAIGVPDQPLSREQVAMLQKGTWMLPIVEWAPRKPCEKFEMGACFDGFAIQGKADSTRRNYTYVFENLLRSKHTLNKDENRKELSKYVMLKMLGNNVKHRPGTPKEVMDMCQPLNSLDFVPFYEHIYHSVLLVAAPATRAYLDRKFSSTVISSMVTGVPVVVERDFLQSYTFISDKHFIIQEKQEELSDVMLRVLQWNDSQHRQKRQALRQLRKDLFGEAKRKLRGYMQEAGVTA